MQTFQQDKAAYALRMGGVKPTTVASSSVTNVKQVSAKREVVAKAATVMHETVSQVGQNRICNTSFTMWLLKEEQAGHIDGEMATVLSSIALACKQIASLVSRSGISNLTGLAGETNIQGEDQKKLDVVSNEVFSNCLIGSGKTGVIASEEEDVPIAVEETNSGKYVVVFDPLDGSSNIDAGISVGSIFGVYEADETCRIVEGETAEAVVDKCVVDVCKPGSSLLASGYALYSTATVLVLTVGHGVFCFTLDPAIGDFVLTHANLQIPPRGKIYSFNEGNYDLWDDNVRAYIDSLKDPERWGGKPYSARYIGSLVGDFHRTILYGGIYGYPGDAKNANGKLRLIYECAPMSMIAEQAGGMGSTGKGRVMDVCPEEVHQRCPLYIGSKEEVEYLDSFTMRS